MKRRTFLLYSAASVAYSGVSIAAPIISAAVTNIDAVNEIKKLRIKSGVFAGGYQIAPLGKLNWYFTNLGLVSIVPYLSTNDLDLYIRSYLDLYLNRLEANASIKDVVFKNGNPLSGYDLLLSDSDDSYAVTFLSLVTMYIKASSNWTWWNKNKIKLKKVAYYNLAVPIKFNGLSSVFQSPRNKNNNTGYLMDNCEVYRGLRDFANMLRNTGDREADYYDTFANGIVTGITTYLFDIANGGFIPNDTVSVAETSFYAGTTCQVFPQAFGLVELSSYFGTAWNYLNTQTPTWQNGSYDPYPWSILGFVAAQRGFISQAKTQMQTINNLFVSNRGLVTINELGFYQKTKSILASA
ncbi:hypothetical protein [Crenothrix polyspora]|uniref:Uncharacterized protein n=1 Tax=Crenothrix polyspora TaxID=360316 RepID=A0A1R4HFC9_9GAMM|nr:hypothetical protein [Crenothrix polyspora]SJM94916.1 conserved exported hypothetical protein [Crenothrix polyspora]